jgi:hypothetical protein
MSKIVIVIVTKVVVTYIYNVINVYLESNSHIQTCGKVKVLCGSVKIENTFASLITRSRKPIIRP